MRAAFIGRARRGLRICVSSCRTFGGDSLARLKQAAEAEEGRPSVDAN